MVDKMMDECAAEHTSLSEANTSSSSSEVNSGTNTSAPSSEDMQLMQSAMLHRLTLSRAVFKSQSRDEPDLNYSDKLTLAKGMFENKPVAFMSRFARHLSPEDLPYLRLFKDDPRYMMDYYIKDIESKCDEKKNKMRIHNRRFEAMKRLQAAGEYFSDEEMKARDPLLYEQLVGQYLTEDEQYESVDKSDLRFSNILVKHMDVVQNNVVYAIQKEYEYAQMEESDSEDQPDSAQMRDEDSESELESDEEKPVVDISEAEKRMLREELLHTMQQRFLHGQDKAFDYSGVDDNVEYDSVEIWEQDAQEKYFDHDSNEESYFDNE